MNTGGAVALTAAVAGAVAGVVGFLIGRDTATGPGAATSAGAAAGGSTSTSPATPPVQAPLSATALLQPGAQSVTVASGGSVLVGTPIGGQFVSASSPQGTFPIVNTGAPQILSNITQSIVVTFVWLDPNRNQQTTALSVNVP